MKEGRGERMTVGDSAFVRTGSTLDGSVGNNLKKDYVNILCAAEWPECGNHAYWVLVNNGVCCCRIGLLLRCVI